MRTFPGSCHCGNVQITLATAIAPEALEVRACQCSFCRRHGGVSASDPAGHVTLAITDAALVSLYQFGLRTCEFILCRRCGVYVAAVLREGGGAWAVVNLNALDDRAAFTRPVAPAIYDAEDAADRIARRKARWSPATIRGL